jgi:tetratricopeptide (TPR) repeat protein
MAFQKAKALQEAEKSVAQGKIAQAIKQYLDILEKEPADVSLLNTVGDLYVRERNVNEGLKHFHRLAEAYVRDGFNVKAIAIYKKISKLDANSADSILKLAELYQLQGLSREAREQYLQAAEFFKKRNQAERALEVFRKLLQLDPENVNFRSRLAAECEQAGKREEAAQTYLEAAETLLRRGDQAAAEPILKKAGELDPKNSRIQLLRARVALARQQLEEAEKIISSSPELRADPVGKQILLDSYRGTGKLAEAENLVLEVFHANPTDFAPVAGLSALFLEKGNVDGAYKLLSGVAETLIAQHNAGPLMEALRGIWSKAPKHIPTLELIYRICEQTADELTLPEVLEALGRVHEEAGDLEKAEAVYLKLTEREPENENYRGFLKEVQHKLGREVEPVEISSKEIALVVEEEEAPPEAVLTDADQEAMVKEALENSDLYARYNLKEKAIAELDKVLQVYPDQIEIHQRILEISHKGLPERGGAAAAELARIFKARGDEATAAKYQAIASAKGALTEMPLPSLPPTKKVEQPVAPPPVAAPPEAPPLVAAPPEVPPLVAALPEAPPILPPPPEPPAKPEAEITAEFPIAAIAPQEPIAAPPPAELSFDLTPPEVVSEPPPAPPPPPVLEEETMELDLSHELEFMAASGPEAAAPPAPETIAPVPVEIQAPEESAALVEESAAPVVEEAMPLEVPAEGGELPAAPAEEVAPVDLEDSRIEIEFYLENGFADEARKAMEELEKKCPGNPLVVELRRRVNEQTGEAGVPEPSEILLAEEEPAAEAGVEAVPTEPEVPQPEPAPAAEEATHEEWELPAGYAIVPEPEPAIPAPMIAPEAPPLTTEFEPQPLAATPEVEEPAGVGAGGLSADELGGLAVDLASSLDGLAAPAPAPPAPAVPLPAAVHPLPLGAPQGAAQLSGLLAEMEGPGAEAAAAAKDDPETHYNLGVAFREMGLLDEAIGEFQKVAKGAGKGTFPPNFLQACSLLAICFMEKKMPAVAAKWYVRAMETPGLDEEAVMALQYELGVAYEQAGDSRNALEKFTEVYSQNIDFRDVADKIRALQRKA